MQETFLICFISNICFAILCSGNTDTESNSLIESQQSDNGTNEHKYIEALSNKCWMTLQAPEFIDDMNELDARYAEARQEAQLYFDKIDFDKQMLKAILSDRAVAQREVHKERHGHPSLPSGINLGGLCMIRMPFSVVFFHRMKLRYDTHFRIDKLHNDIENMVLKVDLSLNNLCLKGAYDRSMTDVEPSALIYTPSFGELELDLEDVTYSIEGRYRVIKSRLVIELIVSNMTCNTITLKYDNSTMEPTKLDDENIEDFLERLKTDFDKWMKDYFNDYLIHTCLEKVPSIAKLEKYDQEKATKNAAFTDNALELMKKRIKDFGANTLHIPKFKIIASHGLTVQLKEGILRGLETMYRRSVATSVTRRQNLRYLDTIIGFSDLKISYKYEVSFPTDSQGPPPLSGFVIMAVNELTAHLSLGMLKQPEVVDLEIDYINRLGPDSITVEGGANVLIANFKHLLKHEIATIMSSTLNYGLRMLKTLPKCDPFIPGLVKQKAGGKIVNIETGSMMTDDSSSSHELTSNDAPATRRTSSQGNNAELKPSKLLFKPG